MLVIRSDGKYIIDADTRLPRKFTEEEAIKFTEGRDDLTLCDDNGFQTVHQGSKP